MEEIDRTKRLFAIMLKKASTPGMKKEVSLFFSQRIENFHEHEYTYRRVQEELMENTKLGLLIKELKDYKKSWGSKSSYHSTDFVKTESHLEDEQGVLKTQRQSVERVEVIEIESEEQEPVVQNEPVLPSQRIYQEILEKTIEEEQVASSLANFDAKAFFNKTRMYPLIAKSFVSASAVLDEIEFGFLSYMNSLFNSLVKVSTLCRSNEESDYKVVDKTIGQGDENQLVVVNDFLADYKFSEKRDLDLDKFYEERIAISREKDVVPPVTNDPKQEVPIKKKIYNEVSSTGKRDP